MSLYTIHSYLIRLHAYEFLTVWIEQVGIQFGETQTFWKLQFVAVQTVQKVINLLF